MRCYGYNLLFAFATIDRSATFLAALDKPSPLPYNNYNVLRRMAFLGTPLAERRRGFVILC